MQPKPNIKKLGRRIYPMSYLYVNFQYLVEIDHDPATWKSGLRDWERDAPDVLEELQDEEK